MIPGSFMHSGQRSELPPSKAVDYNCLRFSGDTVTAFFYNDGSLPRYNRPSPFWLENLCLISNLFCSHKPLKRTIETQVLSLVNSNLERTVLENFRLLLSKSFSFSIDINTPLVKNERSRESRDVESGGQIVAS